MDSLRYELLDKNISITNVCPGPVKTNLDINAIMSQGESFEKKDKHVQGGMAVERCAC
jgi:dehydrogenase/reductase SDR family protein 7